MRRIDYFIIQLYHRAGSWNCKKAILFRVVCNYTVHTSAYLRIIIKAYIRRISSANRVVSGIQTIVRTSVSPLGTQ